MKWLYGSLLAAMLGMSMGAGAEDQIAGVQLSSAPLSAATTETAVEPFVWPVASTVAGRRTQIVSAFGRRSVPDLGPVGPVDSQNPTENHEGVDFAVPVNAPVLAARSGKVLFVGFSNAYASRLDKEEKYRLVILLHSDGKSSRYVHLNSVRVRPGLQVASGQVLGTAGESDEWTQPVLHFEIRDPGGKALNPSDFLTAPQTMKIR